jgi:hypothetical protein
MENVRPDTEPSSLMDQVSYVEIYDLAASLTHTKPPSFHIPFWVLELAGHITVMWAHFIVQ